MMSTAGGDAQPRDHVVEVTGQGGNGTSTYMNVAYHPDESTTDYHPDNREVKRSFSTIEAGEDKCGKDVKDDEDTEGHRFIIYVSNIRDKTMGFVRKHKNEMIRTILILLGIAYLVYFGFAMSYEYGSEPSKRLVAITVIAAFCIAMYFISSKVDTSRPKDFISSHVDEKQSRRISHLLIAAILLGCIIFIVVDVAWKHQKPYNLVSAGGLAAFILVMFIFSNDPAKVQWRTVAWGFGLQLLFAILILRWSTGYNAFKWVGDRVSRFLEFTLYGASFVFGNKDPFDYTNSIYDHYFGFVVLSTVIFFSTMVAVMYYLGVIQVIIKYVAVVMQWAMGTTAAESLNAAANIFIGQSEAPLIIKPLIPDMTKSELHAVMTGGFATIAGSVLAAYISFGVPPHHLICASIMSAPAALAVSKLFYPESEKSKNKAEDVAEMGKMPAANVIEAASSGACDGMKMVGCIAANLIAFVAVLAFINDTLTWFGERVGQEGFTFEFICSYLLYPLPAVMGVEVRDCRKVAELIGVKTFLNEFIAYDRLGVLLRNNDKYDMHKGWGCPHVWDGDDIFLPSHDVFNSTYAYGSGEDIHLCGDNYNQSYYDVMGGNAIYTTDEATLKGGTIGPRSIVITTYALCGFANIGSIGIMLGALGTMAPQRKKDCAQIAVRAMIAGNVACFMTGCIAGLLYTGEL